MFLDLQLFWMSFGTLDSLLSDVSKMSDCSSSSVDLSSSSDKVGISTTKGPPQEISKNTILSKRGSVFNGISSVTLSTSFQNQVADNFSCVSVQVKSLSDSLASKWRPYGLTATQMFSFGIFDESNQKIEFASPVESGNNIVRNAKDFSPIVGTSQYAMTVKFSIGSRDPLSLDVGFVTSLGDLDLNSCVSSDSGVGFIDCSCYSTGNLVLVQRPAEVYHFSLVWLEFLFL